MLQFIGGRTDHFQMGIAPVTHFFLQPQIFIADVKAADKAGDAVDYNNLAVVPVVDPGD